MLVKQTGLLVGILCLLFSITQAQQTNVVVNDQPLSTAVLQSFEQYYRVKIQAGRYWYDPYCGLWGLEGGAAEGLILAGLQLGGNLRADASKGRTGIFINGRQINELERGRWQQILGQTIPGRYQLDSYGNLNYEQGGFIVNVVQLLQRNQSTFYRSSITGIGTGGDGNGFYVIGKDFSYSKF